MPLYANASEVYGVHSPPPLIRQRAFGASRELRPQQNFMEKLTALLYSLSTISR